MTLLSFFQSENKQLTSFLSAVLLGVFLVGLAGCNEKLSVVGNNFPPDTLLLSSIVSTDSQPLISSSLPFVKRRSLSGFGVVYIGKTSAIEAFTLSRLITPDSIPTLTTANITYAKLFITPSNPLYAFGDTTSNKLSFSVFKIKKLWSPQATLDSISPMSDFIDTKPLATYSLPIDLKDSTGNIILDFNKDQIVEWINFRKQFGNDSLNYGIAFIPNASSTVIRRFSSGTVGGSTTAQFATLKVGYKIDTNEVIASFVSGYDGTYISAPSLSSTDKSISIQAAIAVQSALTFDVRAIPKGVAIHLAGLTLTLDPSRSFNGTSGMDSVIYAELVDSSANNLIRTYYGSRLKDVSGKFTNEFFFASLNSAIEAMMRRSGTGSITIQTNPNQHYQRVDKMVFFGPQELDKTKRPRLTIVYSTRPKF